MGIRWLRMTGEPLLMLQEPQSLRSGKNLLPHGRSSLDALAPEPVSDGLLSKTRTRHKLGLIEHPFSRTDRCQNRSIQSEEGRGQGRKKGESRRMSSNSCCVLLGLQAGTLPGSDKGMAFLHILPSSGWHSSSVIGYLKGRSCFVRNDFLSLFLNYAACQFVRYLTEEHKRFMHF